MTVVLGRDIILEYLEEQGIPYIFGNPGTTEVSFVDGCNDHPSIEFVLALHEDIAVAQAMGWARASGKPGVINLHVTPGVAHGLGNLYNAYHARIPLLVIAGQHHSAFQIQEPILTSDLAGMMRPFAKWSYDVRHVEELPLAMQRAFKELDTPPYAPVFLSFASNLFLEKYEGAPPARVGRVAPPVADSAEVDRAADVLVGAASPLIIAGDGVGRADGWSDVVAIAEAIGARVATEGYATMWNFPADHPLYVGPMPNTATAMRDAFAEVDVALLCGVTCQAPIARYDEGGPLIPWRVRTVSVDDNPREVSKVHPVDVGLVGDVARNVAALSEAVRAMTRDGPAVEARARRVRAVSEARREQSRRDVDAAHASDTITATLVAAELRDRLPVGAIYVDEAISNRPAFVSVLDFADPMTFFSQNGISLGYSVAAAVGMQMALPGRRIVNVVGDGSLMYYPQALWNAAASGAPVLFVVLNNGCYRVLKIIIDRMGGPWAQSTEATPGLDFATPAIDFVGLATSMGVEACRATTPTELRAALDRSADVAGPFLVEVVLPV